MPPILTCGGYISKIGAAMLLLAFTLPFTPAVKAEDFVLEVVPLQHRPAEELLPVIKPFVADDGTIQADGARLIIRTHPANLSELRGLIAKLDTALRRLLITVKQLSGDTARDGAAAVEGQLDGTGAHPRIAARVWRTDTRDDGDRVQRVQVMEGEQAYIDVGREIPITDFTIRQTQSGQQFSQNTRYAGATTGFYARPRLNGDAVTVEISPYQTTAKENESAAPPVFAAQSLHTTVTGKLGEWLMIGASSPDVEQDNGAAVAYSTGQRGEQDRRILLQVTVMP